MNALAPAAQLVEEFAIDLSRDELVSFRSIPELVAAHKLARPCMRTVHKWIVEGHRRADGQAIRIPTVKFGKSRLTTREAIAWWLRAISEGSTRPVKPVDSTPR